MRRRSVVPDQEILRALRALGGRATRGDLIMATGFPKADVEQALDALMAAERVQVAVSESAVMTYRLDHALSESGTPKGRAERGWDAGADTERGSGQAASGALEGRWTHLGRLRPRFRRTIRPHAFDRKTLQLIRARAGVISLAELVEHTGLPVERTRREAERLADLYGGEPHPSWDDHVVYAFPDLVESAHGDFHVREPRPAWARADDPMDGHDTRHPVLRGVLAGGGAVLAGALAWLITFPPSGAGRAFILAAVAGLSAGGAFALVDRGLESLARHPLLRTHRSDTLRRYVLGLVFETALKGKGVVSLDRTLEYLRARTGSRWIRRRKVESVLRRLAAEFDAPVTELGGDLFFGFRNVKRQFLASHVQRVRLKLERRADGRTVFHSGDSELAAARRELEDFDRALQDASSSFHD